MTALLSTSTFIRRRALGALLLLLAGTLGILAALMIDAHDRQQVIQYAMFSEALVLVGLGFLALKARLRGKSLR
jgi:hypothetical protein